MALLIFVVLFIFIPLFIVSKLKSHNGLVIFCIGLLNLLGWVVIFLILKPIISGELFNNYNIMVESGLGQIIALMVGISYQVGFVYWIYKFWD